MLKEVFVMKGNTFGVSNSPVNLWNAFGGLTSGGDNYGERHPVGTPEISHSFQHIRKFYV